VRGSGKNEWGTGKTEGEGESDRSQRPLEGSMPVIKANIQSLENKHWLIFRGKAGAVPSLGVSPEREGGKKGG